MRVLGLIIFIFLSVSAIKGQAQVKIIFDTDFGSDADDLGALVTLNNLKNSGQCAPLAIMSFFTEKDVVAAIDAVNTFYGNGDIPIGIRNRRSYPDSVNHNAVIANEFKHDKDNESVELCVDLYRKILSAQPDNSVVIVTLGPLGNIKELMESQSDEYSPLTGIELLRSKVVSFSVMGGRYPDGYKEWNFWGNEPCVTKFVLENLPNKVTFIGGEVGEQVRIGHEFNAIKKENPLCIGFLHFSEHAFWVNMEFKGKILNNACFDQIALLHAVYGDNYEHWKIIKNWKCEVAEDSRTKWSVNYGSKHSRMELLEDVSGIKNVVLELMTRGL